MKVTVIGAGQEGAGLAALLGMQEDVEKLVVCDMFERSLDSAKGKLESLGDRIKCKDIVYKTLDASDTAAVAETIRGMDVCFEGIMPRFNQPVMEACIQEKVNYLDLYGAPAEGDGVNYESTIGWQLEQSKRFEEAGILGIPSCGVTPGWTSLAAQSVIDKLDKVNDIKMYFGDYIDTDEFMAPISPVVCMALPFGPPYPMRTVHGEIEKVDLLESEEEFVFPEPIGKRTLFTCTCQPDIITIPKYCGKEVNVCEEKYFWDLTNYDQKDIWVKALQMATSEQAYDETEVNILEELIKNMTSLTKYEQLVKDGAIRDHLASYSIVINGWKDGQFVEHKFHYFCDLAGAQKMFPGWGATPVFATVGGLPIEYILAIGRGQLKTKGVHVPGQLGDIDGIPENDYISRKLTESGHFILEEISRPVGIDA